MNVTQLKAHCLSYRAATECLHAAPVNVLSYKVGDKTFAYFKTSAPEQWRFSVRVPSDLFLGLTDMPGVKPARYMGRFHWVTIVDVAKFPPAYLQELVRGSYERALTSLSKARQRDILGTEQGGVAVPKRAG
jgi:predicted DNA-binding protein (MmcQ/YjbR family)